MKCSVCGVELQESNRFCGICGTPNPDFKENVEKLPDENGQSVEKSPEAVENIVENVENSGKINVENTVENVENSEENISRVEENAADAVTSEYEGISEKADGEGIYGSSEADLPLPGGEAKGSDTADMTVEGNSAFDTAEDNAPKTPEETNAFGAAGDSAPKTAEETNVFGTAGDSAPKTPEETNAFGTAGDSAPKTPEETNVFGAAGENPHQTPQVTSNFGAGAANPYNAQFSPYGEYQPQNHGYPQQIPQGEPGKEKRVCSLSVVVFCAVVIFILSIVCGVLGGLYAGERSRRVNRTGMSYYDGAYIITAENTGA